MVDDIQISLTKASKCEMKSLRFAGESVGNIERTSHAKRELRVFIETKIVKEIKAILTTYKKEKKLIYKVMVLTEKYNIVKE